MKRLCALPRMLAMALAMAAALWAAPASAQAGWSDYAFISSTIGVSANRVCTGEASRGDIGCAANAPYVSSTSGYLGIGTALPSTSLHILETTGTPSIRIQRSNNSYIQLTAPNGTPYLAELKYGNATAMSIDAGGVIGIGGRFVPSTSLHIVGSIRVAAETSATMNTCDANRTGAIRYSGGSFQFCADGTTWQSMSELASVSGVDRITSGTTNVVANGNTGYVSFTSSGVTTGYYSPGGIFGAVGISTTSNQASFTTLYASGRTTISTTLNSPSLRVSAAGTSSDIITVQGTDPAGYSSIGFLDNNGVLAGSFGYTNRSEIWGFADTVSLGANQSSTALTFFTNGNERARILPNGNMGIGIVTPTFRLHVNGSGGITGGLWVGNATSVSTTNRIYAGADSNNYIQLFDPSHNGMNFTIANNPRVTIVSTGLVGVGTTAPSATLHVMSASSSAHFTMNGGIGEPILRLSRINSSQNNTFGALISNAGGNLATGSLLLGPDAGGGTVADIALSGGLNISANGGQLVLKGAPGYVGIGTTAPSATLHVSGTTRIGRNGATGGYLDVSPYASGGGVDVLTNGQMSFFTGGLNRRGGFGASGGFIVGNGLANGLEPSTTLHISGTIRIADGAEACDANRAGAIRYTSSSTFDFCDGTTGWKSFSQMVAGVASGDRITSGTTSIVANNNNSISFSTAGATRMVIDSSGRLGLGTLIPSDTMHITAGSEVVMMMHSLGTTGATRLTMRPNNNASQQINLGVDTDGTFKIAGSGGYASQTRFAISNSYVGIGTVTPSSTLHVAGDVRADTSFVLTGRGGFNAYTSAAGNDLRVFSTSGIAFGAGSTSATMRLDPSGSLGIGTHFPSSTLHVVGVSTTSGGIALSSGSGTTYFYQSGNNSSAIRLAQSGVFSLRDFNGTQFARFSLTGSTGSTGLFLGLDSAGTAAASTTLQVSGTLRISNGGEACDANRVGGIRYNGTTFQFCADGTTWQSMSELASVSGVDRITSGTTNVVANGDTGYVSFTSSGVTTGYYSPGGIFGAVGISTTSNQASFTTVFASGKVSIGASSTVLTDGYLNINAGTWGTGTPVTATFVQGNADQRLVHVIRNTRNGGSAGFAGYAAEAYDLNNSNYNRAFFGLRMKQTAQYGETLIGAPYDIKFYVGNKNISATSHSSYGTLAMIISESGNVGIGTTEPSSTLHVNGSARITGSWTTGGQLVVGGEGNSGAVGFRRASDGSTMAGVGYISETNTNLLRLHSSGGAGASGGSIAFSTITTERMRINGLGNIGIATTDPSTVLHVSGTIRIADGAEACNANTAGAIRYTSASTFDFCDGATGWKSFNQMVAGVASGDRITSGTTSIVASNNTSLTFNTAGSTRMLIGSTGNVGIGTTNPSRSLSVVGSIGLSGNLNAEAATGLTFGNNGYSVARIYGDSSNTIITAINNNLVLGVSRTDASFNTISFVHTNTSGTTTIMNMSGSSGNVAIGKSVTSYTKLDVSGTMRIAGTGAETCDADMIGVNRRNPITGKVEMCRP